MTPRKTVIAVLPQDEAMALVELGAALERFVVRGSPVDRATARLDEQTAAQMRNLYDEAEDELRDRFAYVLTEPEHDTLAWDVVARAIVDRVLGIFDETAPLNQQRSSSSDQEPHDA